MSKSILTVFGATGQQGGSVVSIIHNTPELNNKYQVRAVTRDSSKPAAKALASAGAEVVQADLNDAASVAKAVEGAYAVFGVTDFWSVLSQEIEEKQGKTIADASINAGVKHFIWSSLPHSGRLTNGKLSNMAHFESKANVEEYIENKKKGTGLAASYYWPAAFFQNLISNIRQGPDGTFAFSTPINPDTRIPWIDIKADTGKYVLGLLEAGPEKADGVQVQAVSEWATSKEVLARVSATLGKKYEYQDVPRDIYKTFLPEAVAEELTETFELLNYYQYYGVDTEKNQPENDKWLLPGTKTTKTEEFAKHSQGWP